ncbi:hypothetical protein [Micromonospora sp. C81]|uniref:hypothetical protein n=1 Tax=Micromonospora sp. C81 TaxID=2824881 RepID=UPI001B3868F7|nr:hypothetical protein [Micromonospora sp. C81]MBQ1038114.1 hypothetical protein [Micromonospora sp. C81]
MPTADPPEGAGITLAREAGHPVAVRWSGHHRLSPGDEEASVAAVAAQGETG